MHWERVEENHGRQSQVKITDKNPDLIQNKSDKIHPNVWGTYLSVCVFYACLFGESPEGVDYFNDPQISDEDRDFL
jgi:hypothetical protein